MPRKKSIPYISLFSGAMGLDLGIERRGFQPLVCNEIDRSCVETIAENRPNLPVLSTSIDNLRRPDFEEAANDSLDNLALVAGGPPCQAFSVFGRRRGLEDKRGRMIFEFLRIVDELRPRVFLLENVRGLHSMPLTPGAEKGSLLDHLIQSFEKVGYRLDCFVVNAVNYGAPQLRERVICIGNRFGQEASFPQPQFSNRPADGLPPFATLGDAIGGDFVDPDPDVMNFSERKLRYLKMVPPGGNWRSLPADIQKEAMGKQYYLKGGRSSTWRKLSFDFPCPTIQTMPNHAATSMCHPTELRALTVGECAAVMEFPRAWKFVGTPTEKMRQVGNAVPLRLAEVAGKVVSEVLARTHEGDPDGKRAGHGPPSRVEHLRPHVRTRSWWRDGEALAGSHSYVRDTDQDQLALSSR